jgi:cell division protein FtsB
MLSPSDTIGANFGSGWPSSGRSSCDNDAVSRSKTTSIPRPKAPAKASDAGRSRLGDFTRPIPTDKRMVRGPRWVLAGALFVLLVAGTVVAALVILPVQTWMGQDDDLVRREAELDELQRVNGQLAGEVDRLQTDDGIREAAREEIGFVDEGDRRSTVLPLPPLPRELPAGWPYNVTSGILAARTAGPAPDATE